jgi:hypothetical protein
MDIQQKSWDYNDSYIPPISDALSPARDIYRLMHTVVLILIMGSVLMAIILLKNDTYGGHAPPQPKDVFLLQNMAYNCRHSTWLPLLHPENK